MPTDNIRRTCSVKGCHKQFTRPQGSNRLKCFDCSPERRKSADSKIINANFGGNQDQQGENQDQEGKLTRLSRLRLEELGVTETWQAASVLALAVLIDTGKHGASGAAGTIKAHREAMAIAEALSDVEKKADVISWIFEKQA